MMWSNWETFVLVMFVVWMVSGVVNAIIWSIVVDEGRLHIKSKWTQWLVIACPVFNTLVALVKIWKSFDWRLFKYDVRTFVNGFEKV